MRVCVCVYMKKILIFELLDIDISSLKILRGALNYDEYIYIYIYIYAVLSLLNMFD